MREAPLYLWPYDPAFRQSRISVVRGFGQPTWSARQASGQGFDSRTESCFQRDCLPLGKKIEHDFLLLLASRLLGIGHLAVYKWKNKKGDQLREPTTNATDGAVQIDADVSFCRWRKARLGSGEPLVLWQGEPWPGSWVAVMMRPAKASRESRDRRNPLPSGRLEGLSMRSPQVLS